jgi:CRISPR-associated protein Cas6/Cse3/CasE, subtype I-E/ECOLI
MPYLSRIWLNPLRTGTQKLLRNPQALHAAVLGASSRQPVTERMLWRLEHDNAHRLSLLVLTRSAPSWEHLVEQAGWPGSDEPQALVRPYEPLLERVVRGREFAFRLRANPVSATRHPDKPSVAQQKRLSDSRPRGVRVPHRTAAHQLAWFTERVTRWGFEVLANSDGNLAVQLTGRERLVFSKADQRRVTLQTATFNGALRVTDADLARESLLSGVGPGRAYGCGLITLAPLPPFGGD